jgi:deoxyribose-phosphate aldolase
MLREESRNHAASIWVVVHLHPDKPYLCQFRTNILLEPMSEHYDKEVLSEIMSLIDLTTLGGDDHPEKVRQLCKLARRVHDDDGLAYPAAVCVYPVFVRQAMKELSGTGIKIASVAGAFPSGQSPLRLRLDEVRYCLDEGADEIDMVISRGRMIAGDEAFVHDEIAAMKDLCGPVHLKAILETGELRDAELIRRASRIALNAGADFIKTSTGKINPAATMESAGIMLQSLRDFNREMNAERGFKPAGGISDIDTALSFMNLAREIMGPGFLKPESFRIGASRLVNKVIEAL